MTNLMTYAAELDHKTAETAMQKDLRASQFASDIPRNSRFVPTTGHIVAMALSVGAVVVAVSGVVGI